ncbi:unnamed protein product [Trifolium pratense]|uniref:Uncharacterized protein n=1 Tax=Trifolium pratense TaxID=57577 RepID=A0ACB0JXS8_TRIPR|nr:unnamed protein product [Trifolium pratense]
MADFFDNCNGQFVKDSGVVAFYGWISRNPMADFWLSAMVHHLPPITPVPAVFLPPHTYEASH